MNTRLEIGPFGVHYAKIVDENGKYVKWASDNDILFRLSRDLFTLNRRGTSIDLKVPYEERKEAKKLGAYWDAYKKVWFTYLDNPKLDKLTDNAKWFTNEALDYCLKHKDTEMVHSNTELDKFIQFQHANGHRTDRNQLFEVSQWVEM
jgi:hypothetical protein